jgi:signal transduction histidine kinase
MSRGGAWPTDPDERLARLAHDLRTPLTIVQGFAELLERGASTLDAERRAEYLGRIAHAGREMKQILDEEREDRLGAELRSER